MWQSEPQAECAARRGWGRYFGGERHRPSLWTGGARAFNDHRGGRSDETASRAERPRSTLAATRALRSLRPASAALSPQPVVVDVHGHRPSSRMRGPWRARPIMRADLQGRVEPGLSSGARRAARYRGGWPQSGRRSLVPRPVRSRVVGCLNATAPALALRSPKGANALVASLGANSGAYFARASALDFAAVGADGVSMTCFASSRASVRSRDCKTSASPAIATRISSRASGKA